MSVYIFFYYTPICILFHYDVILFTYCIRVITIWKDLFDIVIFNPYFSNRGITFWSTSLLFLDRSFIYYLSSCVLVAIVDLLVVVAVVVVVGVVAMLVLVSVVVLLAVVVLLVLAYAYLLFESFLLIWIWGGSGCDVVRWSGQS